MNRSQKPDSPVLCDDHAPTTVYDSEEERFYVECRHCDRITEPHRSKHMALRDWELMQ